MFYDHICVMRPKFVGVLFARICVNTYILIYNYCTLIFYGLLSVTLDLQTLFLYNLIFISIYAFLVTAILLVIRAIVYVV